MEWKHNPANWIDLVFSDNVSSLFHPYISHIKEYEQMQHEHRF